jgi:hypothetical protein
MAIDGSRRESPAFGRAFPGLARAVAVDQVRSTEARMVHVIDLNAEFSKLTMLKNRTPTSSDAERAGAFGRVEPYRDGAIFPAKFAGISAWERHRNGDEIVQIVDGATTLHLMTDAGREVGVADRWHVGGGTPEHVASVRSTRWCVRDDGDPATDRAFARGCGGSACRRRMIAGRSYGQCSE